MKVFVGLLAGISVALAGCGGGGGGGGTNPPVSLSLTGVAATGLAIPSANVSVKCQTGTGSATTNTSGSYSVAISGGVLPCMLEVTNPADGTKMHSVATGSGTSAVANLTPLTELVTARLLRQDPSTYFAALSTADLVAKVTATGISAAQADVVSILTGQVDTTAISNFISTPMVAATTASPSIGDAQDKVLDTLKTKFTSTQIAQVAASLSSNASVDSVKLLVTGIAGNINSGGSNNSVDIALQPYFSEIKNAMNIVYPNMMNGNIAATAIDVNSDGKLDVVMHFIGGNTSSYSGNNISPNAVQIYIQQNNGYFLDQTDVYLSGTNNLGGVSRKMKIIDINGDGKQDIIYAINQEDGRSGNPATNMAAPLAALISLGNKYKVVQFGSPNWYHSVGYGIDRSGKTFAVGAGFIGYGEPGADSYYIDNLGNSQKTNLLLPNISPLSFEFYNPSGINLTSTKLVQGVNGLGLSGMLDGFELQSDNSWLPLARKTIIASIGNINITDRDGKIVDNQPIHTLNGKYTVYGAFVESCKLKSTPVSDYITIFKFSAAEIKNYSPNMTSVLGESLTPFTTLRGVTIRNGVIIEVPLNIDNEQVSDLNSNFFDCNDVNGDGYADLVVYPYNANGLPFVYLNDKSSSFKYAGQSNFQNLTLPYAGSNAVTSIFKDFNGDGINDLLVFPGNPFNPNGVIEYKFLRGVKLFK